MNRTSSKQGSALLIVLGLLSFLLISAVAFSISMRTESSAAAAYRRGLLARELLASAFADAQQTLEERIEEQQQRAGFRRNDTSTYTRQALYPFWNLGSGTNEAYARLLSSNSANEAAAYLLDDAVMRHIPPYVASPVYETLEGDKLSDDEYDQPPTWLPINAKIPENDDADEGVSGGQTINEMTIGRMAWTIINLSDSLDINAIGSNSAYRGIGLTGSEFAFDTMATGSNNPLAADEAFKLFTKQTSPSASFQFPIFCSNADLAQYAAYNRSSSVLNVDNGEISPFSWEDAVANEGLGAYSPFSVYSFWPNTERSTEDGDRANLQNSSSNVGPSAQANAISCNEVKEEAIANSGASMVDTIVSRYESIVNTGGAGRGASGIDFVHMLLDYIDKDVSLAEFEDAADYDLYNNAMPTVENVPMISDIGYGFADWDDGAPGFMAEIEKAINDAIEKVCQEISEEEYESKEQIPANLGDVEIEFDLPMPEQSIALRAYFPGYESATESFTAKVSDDSFVSVFGFVTSKPDGTNETTVEFEEPIEPLSLKADGSLDIPAQQSLFVASGNMPNIVLKGDGSTAKVKILGEHIPVLKDENTNAQELQTTLTFLIDFYFRVQVETNGDIVDLCPSDGGTLFSPFNKDSSQVPETFEDRYNPRTMRLLDAQFFRITRPVTATFALRWKDITRNDETGTWTAVCEFHDSDNVPKATCDLDSAEPRTLMGKDFYAASESQHSYLSFSDMGGVWSSFDPRYNWISPMMGVRDDFTPYCGSENGGDEVRSNFSSPHWVFTAEQNGEVLDSEDEPSRFQTAYADLEAHQAFVPFSWGLKMEDIRYGTNDSGQLLLPAEVGFLPVPCERTNWTPNLTNTQNYNHMSVSDYYEKVAKQSFFRTLPIADFSDGAVDATTYARYKELASIFESFGGENFPEEHRGLVHAFACQDNYLLSQQMRQLALLGIPPSIKQAAFVTRERLTKAAAVNRVNPKLVSTDLAALNSLEFSEGDLAEPKYDTFIADYLFPLPQVSGGNAGNAPKWTEAQTVYEGGPKEVPTRPETVNFILNEGYDRNGNRLANGMTFAERLTKYNESNPPVKLGQNDMNTILAVAKECFGDRQQLFLFVLRADSIKFDHNQSLAEHTPLSTARAVALVWRDAYGELPDRVIYYQYLP